jgi:hypothetical protein
MNKEILLNIKLPNGETVSLSVDPAYSIKDVFNFLANGGKV